MARKHSKGKRSKSATRKQRGGGWGFTGAGSIPGEAGTVSNPMVYSGIGDCRAVKPGYDIPYSQYGASFKGLPGMSGGKRGKSRKGMKGKRTRKQRGGRYGFYPEGDVNTNGQAWWAGSYAPVQRIGCEGGSFNPLNPTHTYSSAPAGAADPNYWLKGGQRGGAQNMAPATYGVGNVDSMYYYAPTGGYANTASTWKDSVGAPVQIQVPYAARAMNQACLTTGGSAPLTGALQTGGKRTRKQRAGGFFDNLKARFSGAELPNFKGLAKKIPIVGQYVTGPENSIPGGVSGATPLMSAVSNATTAPTIPGMNTMGPLNNQARNNAKKTAMTPYVPNRPPMTATNSTGMNGTMNPPAGGRRHKKSRKHRKHHKGRKH